MILNKPNRIRTQTRIQCVRRDEKGFFSLSLAIKVKGKKKEISISDNNYYFTYTHELIIETRSLNEEQVIKKKEL